jgi:ERCC4-type nuclease
VIERKTWADLQSSLRDGRYKEQKARQMRAISEAGGKLIMVYAVESRHVNDWRGDCEKQPPAFGKPRGGVTTKHVDAAITMTSVRDGIPVLRTANTAHTADLVLYLAKKLAAGELSGTSHAVMASAAGYAGFVKSTKKRANMDGGTTWQTMLSSITGVSAKKAKHVVEAYKTPASLCAALSEAEDGKPREALLADILCDNNKRLGNALSKRIAETLCG